MKVRFTILMIVALAVGVLAPTALADPFELRLSAGLITITVQDGAPLDQAALPGVITYIGPVDDWYLNVSTGQADVLAGPGPLVRIDLNSVNNSGPLGGQLTVEFSEMNLSLPFLDVDAPGVLESHIGGTTDGTVQLIQILDRSNTLFADGPGADPVWLDTGALVGPSFSIDQSGVVSDLGPNLFSLTERVTITHSGLGVTSFDATSTVVPVPGAILLGLLGMSVAGLKLRKRA